MDSRAETWRHINDVQILLNKVIAEIQYRALVHDQSKLVSPEVEYFDEFTEKLKSTTYGSEEYKKNLESIKPALTHHYAKNRHHPEFYSASEEWLPVVGLENYYEVSSFGNVRSLDRKINGNGESKYLKNGRLMTQFRTPKDYCRLQLVTEEGCQKNYMVHRLVAQAFIPNPEEKPEVNHKDGNKSNNHKENLEWVTECENILHAYESGLKKPQIKYVVTCEELGLTSFGCEDMAKQCHNAGYHKVRASGVWASMNRGGKHMDLTFIGTKFEPWMNSPVMKMNLVDLIEMLCDWLAATKRHDDGNINFSIDKNEQRFEYPSFLSGIFRNTLPLLQE